MYMTRKTDFFYVRHNMNVTFQLKYFFIYLTFKWRVTDFFIIAVVNKTTDYLSNEHSWSVYFPENGLSSSRWTVQLKNDWRI